MVQRLKALVVLVKDPGLILSTCIVAHSCLEIQFQGIQCTFLTWAPDVLYTVHIHSTHEISLKN